MLPEKFTFTYRDQIIEAVFCPEEPEKRYSIICPVCKMTRMLNVERIHQLSFSGNVPSLHPSIVCQGLIWPEADKYPTPCPWHVWLKDGIARDC